MYGLMQYLLTRWWPDTASSAIADDDAVAERIESLLKMIRFVPSLTPSLSLFLEPLGTDFV